MKHRILFALGMMIFCSTSYGVRISALQDALKTIKFNAGKQEILEEKNEFYSAMKDDRTKKFERSTKFNEYAKYRQRRQNKIKNKSPWKPHYQKHRRMMLTYISHQ